MNFSSKKYSVKDSATDQKSGILKNKLGITDQDKLDLLETQYLIEAYDHAAAQYSDKHIFSSQDICDLHKLFLGDLYDWAGVYRTVDLSSKDIHYCHAACISDSMQDFSENLLLKLTPLSPEMSKQEILERISKIHGELIIIHSFRDGNGRVTRLLCDLLLMQAEYLPMQVAAFYNKAFVKNYHEAIQFAWRHQNYSKLSTLFKPLLIK